MHAVFGASQLRVGTVARKVLHESHQSHEALQLFLVKHMVDKFDDMILVVLMVCLLGTALGVPNSRFEGQLEIFESFPDGRHTFVLRGTNKYLVHGIDKPEPWMYTGLCSNANVPDDDHTTDAGAPVTVVGHLLQDNKTIMVSNARSISSAQPSQQQGWLKAPLKGTYRVLFIIASVQNKPTPAVSVKTAQSYLAKVATFFDRCSNGVVRLDRRSRVVGPVNLGIYDGDGSCITDYQEVIDEWLDVAMSNVRWVLVRMYHLSPTPPKPHRPTLISTPTTCLSHMSVCRFHLYTAAIQCWQWALMLANIKSNLNHVPPTFTALMGQQQRA